jgi:hypothetical protein
MKAVKKTPVEEEADELDRLASRLVTTTITRQSDHLCSRGMGAFRFFFSHGHDMIVPFVNAYAICF